MAGQVGPRGTGDSDRITRAELDPLGFSYYVSANLPLPDRERLRLLESDCAVTRLR